MTTTEHKTGPEGGEHAEEGKAGQGRGAGFGLQRAQGDGVGAGGKGLLTRGVILVTTTSCTLSRRKLKLGSRGIGVVGVGFA